jgi:hypothetical protein
MKYMLLIYGNETGMQSVGKSEGEKILAAYGAYAEAMPGSWWAATACGPRIRRPPCA